MQRTAEYRKTEINTSDNVRVVSLLYDGVVNFIRIAKKRMEHGDIAGKGLYIGKATAIVGELSNSLNMDGGEIAKNLERLYDYILDRLLYANLRNDPRTFDDMERVLEVLRSAWKDMERGTTVPENVPMAVNSVGIGLRI
ncbi:MAG: flagellar export chaperone FliS [Desulfobacterales bacterium]|nr:flagellar export chaperone FliS [Desulfobacterales bacterium]